MSPAWRYCPDSYPQFNQEVGGDLEFGCITQKRSPSQLWQFLDRHVGCLTECEGQRCALTILYLKI
jgi:hypothetical protein